MKRIRVVFGVQTLTYGGAERVMVNLLRRLDPRRFEVHLFLIQKTGELLSDVPSHVQVTDIGKGRTRYAFIPFLKQLRTIKPDIVFVTTYRMNILALATTFFLPKRCKVVVRETSSPKSLLQHRYLPKWYLPLIRRLYPRASAIVAQTEEMKEEIREMYRLDARKIRVFHNPLDRQRIETLTRDVRNPLPADCTNIVSIGRLSDEKGCDFLIRAFARVAAQHKRYRLTIVGDGPQKDDLIRLVQQLDLQSHVHFHGFQSNPYPYLKFADLFVLPSRWEGLPNVLLEAFFLRCPVVTTKCCGFVERIVREGENGWIVSYGDEQSLADAIVSHHQLNVDGAPPETVEPNDFFTNLALGHGSAEAPQRADGVGSPKPNIGRRQSGGNVSISRSNA